MAIRPGGRMVLMAREGDNRTSVLAIVQTGVTYTKRDMDAGLRPYGAQLLRQGNTRWSPTSASVRATRTR